MSRDNRGTGNMMRYAGLATQWMVMLLAAFIILNSATVASIRLLPVAIN